MNNLYIIITWNSDTNRVYVTTSIVFKDKQEAEKEAEILDNEAYSNKFVHYVCELSNVDLANAMNLLEELKNG